MLNSVLIANRGEIACRVIRTARRLGVRTVAVYSDADAKALHVREADEAVHIGPSPARESYLVGEKIIAAAKETGAEAIHPGYGFLSENAEFAQAVMDAGLVWVGPNPSSITAMGLKDAAKKLMAEAGVPVTPGYLGENQDPARLQAEADAIGYPVLIKAIAGGGGKGMRLVEQAEDFADALQSCQREAASSFGNDHVLIEKYIQRPRHIEVQVFGDSHGNVVHLFERDCSLQRRHQKVIEEAPAPGMDASTREAVCAAAVQAAKAVDYVGAGTIEFIADASEGLKADRIWFMEMNTRLQVEHPVTEEITGVDLVEWQLRVASGEVLPKTQDELSINGWAMEARLYAEDPSNGFLPSVGRLDHLMLPESWARVETGVEEGGEVSPFYDPMIAKLVVHAGDRETAAQQLADAAGYTAVWPVKTNAAFLVRALEHARFRTGDIDTGFIPAELDQLVPVDEPPSAVQQAAAKMLIHYAPGRPLPWVTGTSILPTHDERKPWAGLHGFRMNGTIQKTVRIQSGSQSYDVEVDYNDRSLPAWAEAHGELALAGANDGLVFAFGVPRSTGGTVAGAGDGAIISPMPGKIIALEVAAGEAVTKGQKLLTLEAMKMEHSLAAPFDGVVAELNAEAGAQVSEGALLARIEKGEG